MPCTFSRLKCNLVFSLKIILIIIMILHRSLWQICNEKKRKGIQQRIGLFPNHLYWKRMDDHSKNANQ